MIDQLYIHCVCHSEEHVIRIVYDPMEPGEIYTVTYLNSFLPFYKRAWLAFKYIFKIGSQNQGYFDSTSIQGYQLVKLRNLCDKAIDAKIKES